MLPVGHITLHRKLLEWEWYDDLNTRSVFIHLLLIVNYKPKTWKGIDVLRGQVLTSPAKLGEENGLSRQQTRTVLSNLQSTNDITIKATNKYSLVTVTNYDLYQPQTFESTSKPTNNQPANQPQNNQQSNHRITTTKEENKIRNNIYIYEEYFEKFWANFNHPVGKQHCKELFHLILTNPNSITNPIQLANEIIEAAKKYATLMKEKKKPKQYWLEPKTWLQNKGWTDFEDLTISQEIKTICKNKLTPEDCKLSKAMFDSYIAPLIIDIDQSKDKAIIKCDNVFALNQVENGSHGCPINEQDLKKILKVREIKFEKAA